MKWSSFIFTVETEKDVIVYNVLTGSVISLEKNFYNNINSNKVPKRIINYLKKNEFIYDKTYDEEAKFMEILLKEWEDCTFLGLHILTTTGCNFKCPYCYQKGIKANLLNEEKLNQILKYLENYIINNKINESTIEITGGEPTTNWNVVEKLLKGIDEIYKKHKVEYKIYIVTNGYNFTKEKVDLLQKYNWERLQITLDGPDYIHNKRRLLANGNKTFEKIIKNLEYIVYNNKIDKINLRINYDKSNIKYIPKFLEYIKNKFGVDKVIISLGLITKTVNYSEANEFIEKHGIKSSKFLKNYINLYKKALSLGFEMSDIFSFDGMCTAKLKHGFLIDPDGNLVKCVSGVGRKEFVIGNIDNNKNISNNYLFPELYLECLDKNCCFLPICHTGCRFEAFIKNNDVKKNICNKKLLEKINTEIIKINYTK